LARLPRTESYKERDQDLTILTRKGKEKYPRGRKAYLESGRSRKEVRLVFLL